MTDSSVRPFPWIAVGAAALLGLALRIAAAHGSLWLDEAWSATMAADAGTPLAVFLNINHDNNHHLNTLWLQLVGLNAPPLLQRGLSIACGVLAIPAAARIACRHGAGAAMVAALLFAVSPLLVTYGSEARGYAPMLLMLLVAVLLVARWLDDPARQVPAIPLALAVLLGMLAQLTMVFGLAAMTLWIGWMLLRAEPFRPALGKVVRILAPLLLPAVAVLAMVFIAAQRAGTGLQIGNYEPFAIRSLVEGLWVMLLATAGGPAALIASLVLLLPADAPEHRPAPARDKRFFVLALLIPVGVALLQIGNSGAPRYHLIAGAAVLMLIAIHCGARLARPGLLRWPIAALLALVVTASLITDWRIATNLRADPGKALVAMSVRVLETKFDVAVEHPRSAAVLRAAMAGRGGTLVIVETPCPAARFLFLDRDGDQPFPGEPERCGARYRIIAEGHPTGLSGTHWKLYERAR